MASTKYLTEYLKRTNVLMKKVNTASIFHSFIFIAWAMQVKCGATMIPLSLLSQSIIVCLL